MAAMTSPWPEGFTRIPQEPWTEQPVEELALDYDTVEAHGWYDNLDPTVAQLTEILEHGARMIDYSGGTGILIDRLLTTAPGAEVGILNVDSSRKFLRRCLDKFHDDERVAFRLIRYLKDQGRLQALDEVLEPRFHGAFEVLTSTNAVHLYYDLEETIAAWRRVLAPGAHVLVQSGNIGLPEGAGFEEAWIIDRTVEAVAEAAESLVREDPALSSYRQVLEDKQRMAAYRELRERFFLPVRPLSHYTEALETAGLEVASVTHRSIEARTDEWLEFLRVYHEGVLGWIGGSRRVEDEAPTEAAVEDRLEVLARALDRVLGGANRFEAVWTYITARRP